VELELNPSRRRDGRGAAGGFSLVEALLASVILMIVALGVLPLFSRAMVSNLAGSESTSLSSMAMERAEEFYQYPFNSSRLTIPGGSTEVFFDEVWTEQDGRWIDGTVAAAESADKTVLWTRRTRVRQFGINDVLGGAPTPLDGNASTGSVHVKEIEVLVASARLSSVALGPTKDLRVRLFKAL
jgi:Tfp pilus assembly protein PilV